MVGKIADRLVDRVVQQIAYHLYDNDTQTGRERQVKGSVEKERSRTRRYCQNRTLTSCLQANRHPISYMDGGHITHHEPIHPEAFAVINLLMEVSTSPT